MTTQESLAAIKLGSSVIYTDADGVEHGGLAKGPVSIGYNQGLRTFSAFLNLMFLSEAGVPTSVASAPLLTSEMDDEFLKFATDSLTQRDLHATASAAGNETPDEIRERHATRLTEQPRTIGWRPVVSSITPKALCDGSGSERWPNAGWTETGDGLGYPGDRNLPTQAQADAEIAKINEEAAARKAAVLWPLAESDPDGELYPEFLEPVHGGAPSPELVKAYGEVDPHLADTEIAQPPQAADLPIPAAPSADEAATQNEAAE